MQEHLGVLIAATRRRIKQAVLARVAPYRLSAQQFWFLVAIHERPGIAQVELASRVRADAPTASRVAFGLLQRRLVRTEPDPEDRRRLRLFLTAEGSRLARDLSPIAQEIRTAMVAGMTDAQVNALREGLQRVIANIDEIEPVSREPAARRHLPSHTRRRLA